MSADRGQSRGRAKFGRQPEKSLGARTTVDRLDDGLRAWFLRPGMDLTDWRRDYRRDTLEAADLAETPMAQLQLWLEQAHAIGLPEPNALVLATVSATGQVNQRTVLLKELDDAGLVFFTNYQSVKAQELAAERRVCLLFPWHALERQVRIVGNVSQVSEKESDDYFRSRPRESQLGAWASAQSQPIASRAELEAQFAAVAQRFAGQEVPRPDHWGGYRVEPHEVEFWQGGPGRLHDRLVFVKAATGWEVQRLQP